MVKIHDEPARKNGSTLSRDLKNKGKMKVFDYDDDEENDMTSLTLGPTPTIAAAAAPQQQPLLLSPPAPLSLLSPYSMQGVALIPDLSELPLWSYADYNNFQFRQPAPSAAAFAAFGSNIGSSSSSSSSASSSARPHQRQASARSRLGAGRGPNPLLRRGKQEFIPAIYPWVTTRRATVHRFDYLLAEGIFDIRGTVQCKRCEKKYEMGYDPRVEFPKIWRYIAENKADMGDRGPELWKNPVLPTCQFCKHEHSATPIIAEKKRMINWLFLLLGQLLGCCTLAQLKYFCKHSRNHRTGSKDRVLYLTYLGLCWQLDPNGPFDPLER